MKTANYPALPWPWVGLLLCCALVGQEYVRQAAGPDAPLTVYNIAIIAVGVTSLALLVLPPRRLAYLLGFAVCIVLVRYGFAMLKTMVLYKLHKKRIWSHRIFRDPVPRVAIRTATT